MEGLMLFWIALAALVVLADLWAIVSIFRSSKGVETKALWALLITLLPVLGLIAWGLFGPRGITPPSSPEHSK